MSYIPDAYDQWKSHDAEQEAALALLPVCTICMEHIQDEYCFEVNDEIICEKCMVEHFRHNTTDLMG